MQLGRSGRLEDRAFVVAGRIRLAYSRGYWDEWWLEFDDGQHQWLEEDDGRYRLHQSVDTPANIADPRSAKPGQKLSVNGEAWFVTEAIQARIAGAEGTLPAAVSPELVVLSVRASMMEVF